MDELNWPKLRNAIKSRLRNRVEPQDLQDAVQDACGFAWMDVSENGTDEYDSIELACWSIARRAVSRVLRGHSLTYEPRHSERWEDIDYAGTLFYLTSRPGVGEHSVSITRPAGERFLPMHTLRNGCHRR